MLTIDTLACIANAYWVREIMRSMARVAPEALADAMLAHMWGVKVEVPLNGPTWKPRDVGSHDD